MHGKIRDENQVYVFGGDLSGNSAEVYDVENDVWEALPDTGRHLEGVMCSQIADNIYIVARNV